MDLNECFAASLRRYRTQLSLTQEALASKSSLDRTYVSLLERGEKSPTLTTLQKLADTLGVPADRLLREQPPADLPDYPSSYLTNNALSPVVVRSSQQIPIDRDLFTAAINETHDMIDDLYAASIDIATVLGMRNLSSFIGELYATAFQKRCGELFRRNPHQDGYPDLLLMDKVGPRHGKHFAIATARRLPLARSLLAVSKSKQLAAAYPPPPCASGQGSSVPV